MRVYRLTARAFAAAPLSGLGAAISGARWNSIGTRMGYTSTSRALAMLEILAHVRLTHMPTDRVFVPIDIPDDAVVDLVDYPEGWDRVPYSATVQAAGDAWIASGSSLALRVPSAIVPAEFNVLVNPAHARAAEILVHAAEAAVLDPRLLGA
jgi:RES domain-containing protein